ncbi:hypothetical protein FGO68_gene15838 [Halteria grandinella]|uniref:Uncharacterized protein n=1 Tax=Halteria grandinella TaxID=5974 RepID=A0A8J8NHJ0_HALGN|nr:hypothetical protein FGO68_gene15838 [Halteria grandinella]
MKEKQIMATRQTKGGAAAAHNYDDSRSDYSGELQPTGYYQQLLLQQQPGGVGSEVQSLKSIMQRQQSAQSSQLGGGVKKQVTIRGVDGHVEPGEYRPTGYGGYVSESNVQQKSDPDANTQTNAMGKNGMEAMVHDRADGKLTNNLKLANKSMNSSKNHTFKRGSIRQPVQTGPNQSAHTLQKNPNPGLFNDNMNFEGGEEEGDSLVSGGSKEDEEMLRVRDMDHLAYLRSVGITENDLQNVVVSNLETLQRLKRAFRSRYPHLMTSVLKILLDKGEEALACQMVAYYELSLDDEFIILTLSRLQLEVLQYVWVFKRNFMGQRYIYEHETDTLLLQPISPITFNQLIDLITHIHSEETSQEIQDHCISQVCDWRIDTEDNLPLAMLYHYKDAIYLEYIGKYKHFLNSELFLYSLNHGNKLFLQQDLLQMNFLDKR